MLWNVFIPFIILLFPSCILSRHFSFLWLAFCALWPFSSSWIIGYRQSTEELKKSLSLKFFASTRILVRPHPFPLCRTICQRCDSLALGSGCPWAPTSWWTKVETRETISETATLTEKSTNHTKNYPVNDWLELDMTVAVLILGLVRSRYQVTSSDQVCAF